MTRVNDHVEVINPFQTENALEVNDGKDLEATDERQEHEVKANIVGLEEADTGAARQVARPVELKEIEGVQDAFTPRGSRQSTPSLIANQDETPFIFDDIRATG